MNWEISETSNGAGFEKLEKEGIKTNDTELKVKHFYVSYIVRRLQRFYSVECN